MKRQDFCTINNLNRIMYTYNLFKAMEEKYNLPFEWDNGYNFTIYQYMPGIDLVMKPHSFSVRETNFPDDDPIFEIARLDQENQPWYNHPVLNKNEFVLISNEAIALYLYDGDHYDKVGEVIDVYDYSSAEEIFEEYTEEWFFQQLTFFEIIDYEQFKNEVNFCYEVYKRPINRRDIIRINDMSKFDIKQLEGFRII